MGNTTSTIVKKLKGIPDRPKLGLKIVCISDTHGTHFFPLPEGDVLIH